MSTLKKTQTERSGRGIRWDELDRERALARPDLLDLVREACLIESYFAVHMGKLMRLFWYDVTATSTFSIEAYEANMHFVTLRRYLDEVGYRPVSDEEIVALREKDLDEALSDEIEELVNFMATEHFAAAFFRDLGDESDEPVLQAIMAKFSPEEEFHSQLAADLIAARIETDPGIKNKVLERARHFRHVGSYVLPSVSNVKYDNIGAIRALDRCVETLVGKRLSEV
jgi:hypothetical protein